MHVNVVCPFYGRRKHLVSKIRAADKEPGTPNKHLLKQTTNKSEPDSNDIWPEDEGSLWLRET